jgi:predicted CopG family antitoxin
MIHYTLLPEKEIKSLKFEYRIKTLVVLFFFISSSIIVGICSLLPSYILSYSQEKTTIQKKQDIINNSDKEHEIFTTELSNSYKILKKIKSEQTSFNPSDLINKIISYKNQSITLNSFQISKSQNASSTVDIIVQGRALTRNSMIDFKSSLEKDAGISRVELPVSDLTKNKNVDFAFRIKFK